MAIKNIQTSHLVHDLKNPVNIIESGARSLLENRERYGELSPKQEKVVRRMLRNSIRLRHLANSMLEVDMASLGILNISDCTLSGVLRSALVEVFDLVDPNVSDALEESKDIETFKRILSENEFILEADNSQLDKKIRLDETKLSMIVTNLLSNAFKYKQRKVHLRCSQEGQFMSLSVKDDGPGIPECYHQQIFDQYFQCVGKTDDFPVRGHGLGLAGAQALAEALGGALSISNNRTGAEFVVSIKISG